MPNHGVLAVLGYPIRRDGCILFCMEKMLTYPNMTPQQQADELLREYQEQRRSRLMQESLSRRIWRGSKSIVVGHIDGDRFNQDPTNLRFVEIGDKNDD
jgi:hypothetical protein